MASSRLPFMLGCAFVAAPLASLAIRFLGPEKVITRYKGERVTVSHDSLLSTATITCLKEVIPYKYKCVTPGEIITCPKGEPAIIYRYKCVTPRAIRVDVVDSPRILNTKEIPDEPWTELKGINVLQLTKEELITIKV